MALQGGSSIVDTVRDLVSAGAISTKAAESFLQISRESVAKLESEKATDGILEVQWRVLHTLSTAYKFVPGRAESALSLGKDRRAGAGQWLGRGRDHAPYGEWAIGSAVRIGDSLDEAARLDEALAAYRAGHAGIAKLVAENPSNGEYVRLLIYIRQSIGDV